MEIYCYQLLSRRQPFNLRIEEIILIWLMGSMVQGLKTKWQYLLKDTSIKDI